MSAGYRWLTPEGAPCSPRHRSPVTAARWLAREAREPRTRPRPAVLVSEARTRVTRRPRRRPLEGPERAALLGELAGRDQRRLPLSARAWLARQAKRDLDRQRRRRGVSALTSQLRAGVR